MTYAEVLKFLSGEREPIISQDTHYIITEKYTFLRDMADYKWYVKPRQAVVVKAISVDSKQKIALKEKFAAMEKKA